jgi:phage terminase large subunit
MKEFNPKDYIPELKQQMFLTATSPFVCYGGARGGGKSFALDFKCCCMAAAYPNIKTIIIRKAQKDVKKNHLKPLKDMIKNSARWNETDLTFYWNNGSSITFGYCDTAEDLDHLQGQEYQIVCLEESTQFTYDEFTMICAICRGGDENYPKRIYLTCNPGGIGHAWTKRLFIDRQYTKDEHPEDYSFIQALPTDNSHNGKDYIHKLELLPSNKKAAWLYGEWDEVTGQFFTEWNDKIHIISPRAIPSDSHRYFVMDYGRDMLAGYWIAVDYDGNAVVYREVYQGEDNEDTGPGLMVSDAAQLILDKENQEKDNNIFIRLAPPDLWSKQSGTGKSQVELFADNGVTLTKADNSRIDGWMALREWLKVYKDSNGKETSRLKVFNTCRHLIRVIPQLQYDTKKPNDAAKVPHELTHAPDALRYWAISRPFGALMAEPERHFDVDDMREDYERTRNPGKGYFGGEITSSYLGYGG